MVHEMAGEKQEAVNLISSYKICSVKNKDRARSWHLDKAHKEKLLMCFFFISLVAKRDLKLFVG